MAKMHSRKKGHAGSKRPLKPTKPSWQRYKPKEIELLVAKLIKEGKTMSETGLILRDSYGIPNIKQATDKTILQIVQEKKLVKELPEDMLALMKRHVALKKHSELHKQDMSALRGLQLTEAKIKRLVKYYQRARVIPIDWKFDPENVKIYVG
ncbi:30S ribosomal protein S15 [Candidatus Woesearchaeota archaeon]|nr:30S ribosomal protein S15 [Candidatus Woesearchaeota archaeon]